MYVSAENKHKNFIPLTSKAAFSGQCILNGTLSLRRIHQTCKSMHHEEKHAHNSLSQQQ